MRSLIPMNREGERGFSAVEALVSVAVLALIVLFAVTMFQSSNQMARSAKRFSSNSTFPPWRTRKA